MKKILGLFCVLLLSNIFVSCNKGEYVVSGDDTYLCICPNVNNQNTKSTLEPVADNRERGINVLRVIAFDPGRNGVCIYNKVFNVTNVGRVEMPIIKLPAGLITVYAIVNENNKKTVGDNLLSTILNNIVNENELLSKMVKIDVTNSISDDGLLMCGKASVKVEYGYTFMYPKILQIDVERVCSKISINMVKEDVPGKVYHCTVDNIEILCASTLEFLCNQDTYPAGNQFNKSVNLLNGSHELPFSGVYYSSTNKGGYTESSHDTAMKLKITHTMRDESNNDRITVVDTFLVTTGIDKDYGVRRNTHYIVNITARYPYLHFESLTAVAPWELVDTGQEFIGDFLNVSDTTFTVTSANTSSTNGVKLGCYGSKRIERIGFYADRQCNTKISSPWIRFDAIEKKYFEVNGDQNSCRLVVFSMFLRNTPVAGTQYDDIYILLKSGTVRRVVKVKYE